MDADGGPRVSLVGPHLIQHLQDGRDGLRHTVVRPRDVMQLFQSPATLESIKTVFKCYAKRLSTGLDNSIVTQKLFIAIDENIPSALSVSPENNTYIFISHL